MASVADYKVLLDGVTTFGGNENAKVLKFSVPTNMVFSSAAKMILSFKFKSPAEGTKLNVYVNATQVMTANFDQSGFTRAHWTTFSPGIPFPEGSSLGTVDVKFTVDTVDKTFVLEDVVMSYKVNV